MAQAGWFPDPGGQPGMFRYWNGVAWTDQLPDDPGGWSTPGAGGSGDGASAGSGGGTSGPGGPGRSSARVSGRSPSGRVR